MLLQRGIGTFDEAKSFFRDGLESLHDPFLMKDMDKAVARLQAAVAKHEKILFYGDYDVDGTTAVALCMGFFSAHCPNIGYYIPDRYTEGYGLSDKGLEYAAEQGYSLVVTLDCGIRAVERIARGKKAGLDFIVCDHHTPGSELPPAVAVLDPKQPGCPYPFKELSGCGVGFKLMQAYCQREGIPSGKLFEYLDLVAISTAADIVPVVGENRVLVREGLTVINNSPRPGIKALMDVSGFKSKLTVTHIVFGLGPRINAAGRMAHARQAVDLLLETSAEEAQAFAASVNLKNQDRKDVDGAITEEALAMIGEMGLEQAKTTVLYQDNWHKGVIGIVASRCIEKYHRPTIILTASQGKATGSARSVPGFDIHEAISACAGLLEQFGGHMYAAGLTMPIGNVGAFRQKFEEVVAASIAPELLVPKIEVDLELPLDQLSTKFYAIIRQMAPFGPQNMQPVFVSEVEVVPPGPKLLKEKHLKMGVRQPGGSKVFDALAFNMTEHYPLAATANRLMLCYSVEENNYMGRDSLQLMVRDMKPAP